MTRRGPNAQPLIGHRPVGGRLPSFSSSGQLTLGARDRLILVAVGVVILVAYIGLVALRTFH